MHTVTIYGVNIMNYSTLQYIWYLRYVLRKDDNIIPR